MMSEGKYVPENSTMILVDGENSGEIFTTQISGYQGSTFKLLNISNEMYKPFILYVIKSYQTHEQKNEKEALTNIIQLVRFALHQIERLESLCSSAQQRFNLWYGQMQRDITPAQIALMKQIVDYVAANGTCGINDVKDYDKTFICSRKFF